MEADETGGMDPALDPHYRHRFPAEIISHAIWLYHVFSLSLRDVELILAERGVVVSYETVRRWCKKFAASFADRLRRGRPRPGDKWHLDEVFIRIQGVQRYLWRAVDQDDVVLDILVQARRDGTAAKRFFKAERSSVRAAGDRDRQIAQLRCRSASIASWRRASTKPISEQSGRELTSTDTTTRAANATVQIVPASPGLPLRPRIHLRSLPSPSTPTCNPHLSRHPVGRFQDLASRDVPPVRMSDRRLGLTPPTRS
jgi:transposase-like protein